MKVIHVETGMHLWGGAQQVLYLIGGLGRLGVDNVLVCAQGSEVSNRVTNECKVYALKMKGDVDLGFIGRMRRVIRDERPDLVHVHSRRGADPLAAIASHLAGVPVIVSRRVDNAETPWIARLKYRLYKKIIVVAEGIREVLVSEGVNQSKMRLIHSAVDRRRFKPEPDRPVLDKELGIDREARLIAMVAQYIPRKGHRVLFDAMPAVIAQYPETLVLCCGSGPEEKTLDQEIVERGLQDHVRMLGFRDDLEKILPCCELSLHPALTEGICGAALQAQSCSVATIGSRVGGLPEAISEGVTGLLVEPGNPDQLAGAIIRLLGDDALRIQLAEAGPGYVGERFSITAMVRDNLAVYREVLA